VSVAFRREDDDAHREPVFELPIPPGPNLVTARGLEVTRKRVEALEAAVAGAADAEAARPVARDLRYWRTRLATAQVQPAPDTHEAAFGSRVRFRLNGQERTLDIVGDDEAEPAAGRVAFSAPLARALIGGAAGERLPFGGREDAIEVLETGPIPA